MTTTKPTTPADHIAHAKETLASFANPAYAIAHALIAIAETLTTPAPHYTIGALEAKAAAEAVAKARKLIP